MGHGLSQQEVGETKENVFPLTLPHLFEYLFTLYTYLFTFSLLDTYVLSHFVSEFKMEIIMTAKMESVTLVLHASLF